MAVIATTLTSASIAVGSYSQAGELLLAVDYAELRYGIAKLDYNLEPVAGDAVTTTLNGTKIMNATKGRIKFDLSWEAQQNIGQTLYTNFYGVLDRGLHYHLKRWYAMSISSISTNTITVSASGLLSTTNDAYNGFWIEFTASGVTYQREITDYDQATRTFTYAGANVASVSGFAYILQPLAFRTVWILKPNNSQSDTIVCVPEGGAGYGYDITGGGIWSSPGFVNLVSKDMYTEVPLFLKQANT